MQRRKKSILPASTKPQDKSTNETVTEVVNKINENKCDEQQELFNRQNVHRNISLNDVAAMQQALFPEEAKLTVPPKRRLCDRWGSETRRSAKHIGENSEKSPGLDLYNTILSRAQFRL